MGTVGPCLGWVWRGSLGSPGQLGAGAMERSHLRLGCSGGVEGVPQKPEAGWVNAGGSPGVGQSVSSGDPAQP